MHGPPALHRLLTALLFTSSVALAQSGVQTDAADTLGRPQNERPEKPTFIAELDQRFTFFHDTRSERNRHSQINLWGARAGLLLPSNIKLGVGYYFTYQNLDALNYQWREYQLVDRNIRFATVYLEKFWFRRKNWEFSTLAEAGWGFSRYSLQHTVTGTEEDHVAHSVPAGIGAIFSVKLPPLGPIRALRWFGLSFLTGYRFAVRRDLPTSSVNWNGFYYSVGPAIFLDRFSEDFAKWRQKRKDKRSRKH